MSSLALATPSRLPAIELVSVKDMPRDEWLKWRTKGIGGSDVAYVMHSSPWGTLRDLYWKKRGVIGALDHEDEKRNWVAKKMGHLLEPLVAEVFASKTGYEPYEIQKMFQHPEHKFMLANVDFFFDLPQDLTLPCGRFYPKGTKCIFEAKTANSRATEKWQDGAVPENYEWQTRHYMAVMDIELTAIGCLFDNNEDAFAWQWIPRDLSIEEDMIEAQADFWHNYVVPGIEPVYVESADLILDSIVGHYGLPSKEADPVTLPVAYSESLKEYEQLKDEKSQAEKVVGDLKDRLTRIRAFVVEEMNHSAIEARMYELQGLIEHVLSEEVSDEMLEVLQDIVTKDLSFADVEALTTDLMTVVMDEFRKSAADVLSLSRAVHALFKDGIALPAVATCTSEDGVVYNIKNTPAMQTVVDRDALQAQHPTIYEKFVSVKQGSPRFSLTKKKAKKAS